MKSYKLHPTDAVYWTLNLIRIRRGFAVMFTPDIADATAIEIQDYGDLIKSRTIKSELLRMMYDTQK